MGGEDEMPICLDDLLIIEEKSSWLKDIGAVGKQKFLTGSLLIKNTIN